MSDKSTLLRGFNTHFFDFIDDIIRIFPEKRDLLATRRAFQTIKQANPSAIIKAWNHFIYKPYEKVIKEGDITFFFAKDYSRDISHLRNANDILTMIDSFREPVKEMSDSNKEHTMKYIQNLSKLSDMYIQEPTVPRTLLPYCG